LSVELTPFGGAIGTACDVPEAANISNAAIATAKAVFVISFLLFALLRREPVRAHNIPK
jgi:hypothetical protein